MMEARLDTPVAAAERAPQVATLVRYVGRRVTRSVGLATAPLRPLPDFLVIGAKRGGTTSMFHYLLTHPQVVGLFPSARHLPLRAERKGVHFLDARFGSGPSWYRSNFTSRPYRQVVAHRTGRPVLSGEATPYYLFHPHAAARARAVVPHVRILVLLRDPTDRAYSHYQEQRRRGHEPLESFAEAVDAEHQRLAGEHERLDHDPSATSFAHEHQSYVAQGRYLEALEPWFRSFPAEQLHIVRSEDMYDDPQEAYDSVLAFLGLSPFVLSHPEPLNGTTSESMPVALRRRLDTLFEPHNRALETRLGRSFAWGRS